MIKSGPSTTCPVQQYLYGSACFQLLGGQRPGTERCLTLEGLDMIHGASAAENSNQRGTKKPPGGTSKPRGRNPTSKYKSSAKKQRATDGQMAKQLQLVKGIKDKLKDVVERFEAAYPEGVNFTPGAKELDLV